MSRRDESWPPLKREDVGCRESTRWLRVHLLREISCEAKQPTLRLNLVCRKGSVAIEQLDKALDAYNYHCFHNRILPGHMLTEIDVQKFTLLLLQYLVGAVTTCDGRDRCKPRQWTSRLTFNASVRPHGLPLTTSLLQIQRRLDGLWQVPLVGVSARVRHGRCLQARTQALILGLKLLNFRLHLVPLAVQFGVGGIKAFALLL